MAVGRGVSAVVDISPAQQAVILTVGGDQLAEVPRAPHGLQHQTLVSTRKNALPEAFLYMKEKIPGLIRKRGKARHFRQYEAFFRCFGIDHGTFSEKRGKMSLPFGLVREDPDEILPVLVCEILLRRTFDARRETFMTRNGKHFKRWGEPLHVRYDLLVFFPGEGTCGIQKHPAGFQHLEAAFRDGPLKVRKESVTVFQPA